MITHNTKFGEVQYEGKTLILSQHAYLDGNCNNEPVYYAHAEDLEGNEYFVEWQIINENCEDESDACNWDEYTVEKID